MSGPFQVGDVVEKFKGPCSEIPRGAILRIERIVAHHWSWPDTSGDALHFGYPWEAKEGWNSLNFRHLPKADEQFTAQMHALRPIKVEEPA